MLRKILNIFEDFLLFSNCHCAIIVCSQYDKHIRTCGSFLILATVLFLAWLENTGTLLTEKTLPCSPLSLNFGAHFDIADLLTLLDQFCCCADIWCLLVTIPMRGRLWAHLVSITWPIYNYYFCDNNSWPFACYNLFWLFPFHFFLFVLTK